jgi:hypothetical protein
MTLDCKTLTLRLAEDGRVFVERTDGATVSYKEIESQALYKCFSDSLKVKGCASGFLPPNCLHFSMDGVGTRHVVMEYGALAADVSYENTRYPNFPLPRLIFGFGVGADGRVVEKRIGVVENKRITPDSKMYVCPFSNVNENGSVCVGANPMPKIESLSQLMGLPSYILTMPNNDDHYSPEKNRKGWASRELFERLKDKDAAYYYSDVLVESGKKVADFMKA